MKLATLPPNTRDWKRPEQRQHQSKATCIRRNATHIPHTSTSIDIINELAGLETRNDMAALENVFTSDDTIMQKYKETYTDDSSDTPSNESDECDSDVTFEDESEPIVEEPQRTDSIRYTRSRIHLLQVLDTPTCLQATKRSLRRIQTRSRMCWSRWTNTKYLTMQWGDNHSLIDVSEDKIWSRRKFWQDQGTFRRWRPSTGMGRRREFCPSWPKGISIFDHGVRCEAKLELIFTKYNSRVWPSCQKSFGVVVRNSSNNRRSRPDIHSFSDYHAGNSSSSTIW